MKQILIFSLAMSFLSFEVVAAAATKSSQKAQTSKKKKGKKGKTARKVEAAADRFLEQYNGVMEAEESAQLADMMRGDDADTKILDRLAETEDDPNFILSSPATKHCIAYKTSAIASIRNNCPLFRKRVTEQFRRKVSREKKAQRKDAKEGSGGLPTPIFWDSAEALSKTHDIYNNILSKKELEKRPDLIRECFLSEDWTFGCDSGAAEECSCQTWKSPWVLWHSTFGKETIRVRTRYVMCSSNMVEDLRQLCTDHFITSDEDASRHGLILFTETEILDECEGEELSIGFSSVVDSFGASVTAILPKQSKDPENPTNFTSLLPDGIRLILGHYFYAKYVSQNTQLVGAKECIDDIVEISLDILVGTKSKEDLYSYLPGEIIPEILEIPDYNFALHILAFSLQQALGQ